MNAPFATRELFGSVLQPLDTSDLVPSAGAEIERFVSTSRGDRDAVNFINFVFNEAAESGVSDIHFQDDEFGCVVRFRADGILRDRYRIHRGAAEDLDTKMRARCRISRQDRDSAFDGSFWIKVESTVLDVRVSFLPTRHGQNVVCRLLDQRNAGRRINQIYMRDAVRSALLESLCNSDNEGIILVTGPTGSGKTSTLYACLNEVNHRGVNIVTAEDPVEYRLPGANQVAVHPSRSFAQILRSFLRQDFDYGLVGEIRDRETAEIAFQAANTGHMMLSTLHTNSSLATVNRLADLGIDSFTIASSTRCILAQRLPQKLCPHCQIPHVLDGTESHILDVLGYTGSRDFFIARPGGCDRCRDGELGRIPVIELLQFNRALVEAVIERDQVAIKAAAEAQTQYLPIAKAALEMCAEGLIGFNRAIALGGN